MKNVIAYVSFLSVKHILLVDIHSDLLQLTENNHLAILSAIDLYEIQKCEVNYFNYNFTYDITINCQEYNLYNQSINKHNM